MNTQGAAYLPDGTTTTRRNATELLQAGKIDYYRAAHGGQSITTAKRMGVSITTRTLPNGWVEVRLGTPRKRLTADTELNTLIATFDAHQRDALRVICNHILSKIS